MLFAVPSPVFALGVAKHNDRLRPIAGVSHFSDAVFMKLALAASCYLALSACPTTQARRPFTDDILAAAKQRCGAPDAYVVETKGELGASFRGVATDFGARHAQALCLKEQLRDTEVRFIGFLSQPPIQ